MASNESYLQTMVEQKKSTQPYIATNHTVYNVITDFDHFPYSRWYRGRYQNTNPVVIEREAGFRQRQDWCYQPVARVENEPTPTPLNHCIQNPVSTVYPCVPTDEQDERIKHFQEICTIKYR